MMTIEYKILFEVRIFHDYYMIDKSEKSFYGLSADEQKALLQKKLRNQSYDIHRNLHIILSPSDRSTFKNLRLRFTKSPLGFYIAMEVKSEASEDGAVRYRPAIRLNSNKDTVLNFGLDVADPLFFNISNIRLNRDSGLIYYFSNRGTHTGNSLSKPIELLQQGQEYRMGDLALVGDTVHEALEDNDGNEEKWQSLPGDGYVHQSDISLPTDQEWYKGWLLNFSPAQKTPFALVQIVLHTDNPDLSPIDKDGYLETQKNQDQIRPVHPVYELRFLSRSTYWRYKKAAGFTTKEAEHINGNAGDILTFTSNNFVTKKPRYLTLQLLPLGTHSFRLPNAQPNSIKSERGRLYSDIYFNEVNPIPNFSDIST